MSFQGLTGEDLVMGGADGFDGFDGMLSASAARAAARMADSRKHASAVTGVVS